MSNTNANCPSTNEILLSFEETPTGILVYAFVQCLCENKRVATILDHKSKNPLIKIEYAVGINLVKRILKEFEELE